VTDRTAAALASALPEGIAGAWHRGDIARIQAAKLAESGYVLVPVAEYPPQTFAEHTAKAISKTVGSTGNSTGPHLHAEFIHDHVEASDE
jgi:hypothetical protein